MIFACVSCHLFSFSLFSFFLSFFFLCGREKMFASEGSRCASMGLRESGRWTDHRGTGPLMGVMPAEGQSFPKV